MSAAAAGDMFSKSKVQRDWESVKDQVNTRRGGDRRFVKSVLVSLIFSRAHFVDHVLADGESLASHPGPHGGRRIEEEGGDGPVDLSPGACPQKPGLGSSSHSSFSSLIC